MDLRVRIKSSTGGYNSLIPQIYRIVPSRIIATYKTGSMVHNHYRDILEYSLLVLKRGA